MSVGLFAMTLVPRLNAVWRGFITPDEPIWVFRAFRFLQALELRRWPDTFQIGHPGVVTMWVGALGIWWRRWRDPSGTAARLDWIDRVAWATPDNSALFDRLAVYLPPARLAMAALTSLGVVGVYWLAGRLWDRRVALVGAALIALDPFIAGLSGLLHVDAPATTFMLLSLLAWLNALDPESGVRDTGFFSKTRFLADHVIPLSLALLSGLCAGLGMLSKSPAIWMAGAVGLSALLYLALVPPRSWRRVRRVSLLGTAWLVGVAGGLFTFPAMWGNPLGVIRAIYGLAGRHLDVAHRVSFFRGVAGRAPGTGFYPTVFLYRLTPIALGGLLLSLVPLFGGGHGTEARRKRASLASLWVYALGFAAFITVGAKKLDRYLLPAFPSLDLVAAAGWIWGVRWLYGGRERRDAASVEALPRSAFRSVLALLIVLQGATIMTGWPYYLSVYNPLAGGLGAALRTLPVGWGEGMEQIAAYLRDQPGQVIAAGSPVTLAPLVDDEVILLDEASQRLADHVLIAATDRQLDPERAATLVSESSLVHTVRIAGHSVLWLYHTNNQAEVEHLARYGAPGDVVVCDAPSPFARHGLGDSAIDPCQIVAGAGEAEIAELLNGWSAQHSRLWYLAYVPQGGISVASPIVSAALRRQLETHAVRLDHVDLGYVTATLYILPDEPRFAVSEDVFAGARFGGSLAVTDGVLAEQRVAADGAVRLRLRWQALAAPQADYAPFVHLLDADGHMRKAGRGEELLVDRRHWPTSRWAAGESVERSYALGLPTGLPPGRYWLAVGLADPPSGQWVPVVDDQGRVVGSTASLLALDVDPPEKPPEPGALHLARRRDTTWEERLQLLGYSHPAHAYVGQRVVVEAGWLGLSPMDGDYRVRLDLRTPAGEVAARETLPLSGYPTSRWRVGEVLHELYDLRVPAELDEGEYTLTLAVLDEGEVALPAPDAASHGGSSLGTLSVAAQDRLFELPQPPQVPLSLALGQSISLLGYDLSQATALPGQNVSLTLYWRCDGTIDTSYTVFVHLLDGEGRVRGQQDRVPGKGRAPTSGWVAGQIVVDPYAIPLDEDAPPGMYRVEVGMYNAQDMVRLPVIDGEGSPLPEDRILLDQEVLVE